MSIVYLSLGSNLGNRQKYLDRALELLNSNAVFVRKVSTVIETKPVGGPAQGKYLNAVLKAVTEHSPEALHYITQSIEHKLGRVRSVKNGPRVIDIDILLYDDIKLVTKTLLIPHPRMFGRDFVMNPLIEIEPSLCVL